MLTSASDIPLLWQQANGPQQMVTAMWNEKEILRGNEHKLPCTITSGSYDAWWEKLQNPSMERLYIFCDLLF